MNKFQLSLTSDYCSDWSVVNAVREILQNALDNPERFEYTFTAERNLVIRSLNTTIPPKSLLLGASTKSNDKDSVGGFGEGYKIAALVLIREGHNLVIHNGNRLWTPVLEYNELFGAEVLTFHEEIDNINYNEDLTFTVSGITEELETEIRESCLYLQKEGTEFTETSVGRFFKRDGVSKLFVGGLFICDIPECTFSYDFKPDCLRLNRDRKSVSGWDLFYETSRMCMKGLSQEKVAVLLRDGCNDVKYCKFHSFDNNESFNLFKEEFGVKMAVEDEAEKEALIQEGYKESDIKILGDTYYTESLTSSSMYIDSLSDFECTPEDEGTTALDMLYELSESPTLGRFDYLEVLSIIAKLKEE